MTVTMSEEAWPSEAPMISLMDLMERRSSPACLRTSFSAAAPVMIVRMLGEASQNRALMTNLMDLKERHLSLVRHLCFPQGPQPPPQETNAWASELLSPSAPGVPCSPRARVYFLQAASPPVCSCGLLLACSRHLLGHLLLLPSRPTLLQGPPSHRPAWRLRQRPRPSAASALPSLHARGGLLPPPWSKLPPAGHPPRHFARSGVC
mmetsp:Transcript_148657/g.259300  ORF Transcript_148657/g.259300 Transcript_148657/m.259300 type:complete len:206 (-) Transcript_148657:615-1232(-)